jgi:TPP-dependent 2-oxoacid decarboxylase
LDVRRTQDGSFSERVPILVISGGPGEEERKLGVLIHHQAKEIESQLRIYHEVTCAARQSMIHYARPRTSTKLFVRFGSINSQAISRFIAIWSKRRSPFQMRLSIGMASFLIRIRIGTRSMKPVRETAERFIALATTACT